MSFRVLILSKLMFMCGLPYNKAEQLKKLVI